MEGMGEEKLYSLFLKSVLFVQGILRTYIEGKLKGTLQEAKNVCLIDFAIAESDSQSVPSECHFE